MKFFFLAFTLGFAFFSSALAAEYADMPEVKSLTKGMPVDVSTYIARLAECQHWGGEEPYDKERAQFIAEAVKKAKCNDLNADEKKLTEKYSKSKKTLKALDEAKKLFE